MNLRKFRKATAKKRMLDNHKETSGKKKRKKSDSNNYVLEPEVETFLEDNSVNNIVLKPEDQPSIGGDTTSESNTMTLEQFTDIVLASEGRLKTVSCLFTI